MVIIFCKNLYMSLNKSTIKLEIRIPLRNLDEIQGERD